MSPYSLKTTLGMPRNLGPLGENPCLDSREIVTGTLSKAGPGSTSFKTVFAALQTAKIPSVWVASSILDFLFPHPMHGEPRQGNPIQLSYREAGVSTVAKAAKRFFRLSAQASETVQNDGFHWSQAKPGN